jgi:hypothetical protein
VVDAEDGGLLEHRVERAVELAGRGQVEPEGLLHHHARPRRAARLGQALDDGLEHGRRDGEVVERARGRSQRLPEGLEGGRLAVIPVHVAEQAHEPREGHGVQAAVPLDRVPGPGLELLEVIAGLGHADHGHVERPAPDHGL